MKENRKSFDIYYDSTDPKSPLANHSIDVTKLSEALVGINGALQEANEVVNGAQHPLQIRIAAGGFEKGSFGIPLELIQDPAAIDVLKAIGITVVSGSVVLGGALGVIQKLKGQKIHSVKRISSDEGYTIIVDDKEIVCSEVEKRLVTNKTFRKHVNTVFAAPMENSSTDIVRIKIQSLDGDSRQDDPAPLELNKSDAQELSAPENLLDEQIEERDVRLTLQFKSAFSNKSRDWTVDMFGRDIKVDILDKTFLEELNQEDAEFNFGRKFDASIRETTTTKGGAGRKSKKYSILKIHKPV